MSKTGRPPKPTNLKVLQGTDRPDRARKNEPKPPTGAECPSWLDREAKKEWKRVAPILERLGLLTVVDTTALAAYCQSYSHWQQAERFLRKNGMTYTTQTGYARQRPEVAISQKALAQVKMFCSEFGLTPSARARMELPEVPIAVSAAKSGGVDAFEDFLNSRKRKGNNA